jgi:hypothetical protein
MCGRFTLKTSRAKIAELIGNSKSLPLFEPRYNIAPSQPVLAVRIEPERGEREGVMLKWGLIPSWAKEPGIGNKLANARADTVAEKPAFRSVFKKRRCLVIVDEFYEFIWTILIPLHFHGDAGPLKELDEIDRSTPPREARPVRRAGARRRATCKRAGYSGIFRIGLSRPVRALRCRAVLVDRRQGTARRSARKARARAGVRRLGCDIRRNPILA